MVYVHVLTRHLLQIDKSNLNFGGSFHVISEFVLQKFHRSELLNERDQLLPILGERITDGLCIDDGNQLSVIDAIPRVQDMSTALVEGRVHEHMRN